MSGPRGASLTWDSSSRQLSAEDARRSDWTPMYIGWAGATLIALILLAAGPGLRDRWRSH
jgi:hypothetical protein